MGEPAALPEPAAERSWAGRAVSGFGRFWWDFLIGDTPELFVGGVVAIALVALVCLDHRMRTAAAVLLPVLVAAVLGASVWRAARHRSS